MLLNILPKRDDTPQLGGHCGLLLNSVVLLDGGLLQVPIEDSAWSENKKINIII